MENSLPTDKAKTILLVDDEESIMFFLQKLLVREGYNIIKAGNGKEAIEIYKSNPDNIDLILMDITMPVMSGIDAYKELYTHDPDIKILLMSAYSKESFENMEKINFIRKPIYPIDLMEKIRNLLESKTV
jgi:CheY-like chemotaxis protein